MKSISAAIISAGFRMKKKLSTAESEENLKRLLAEGERRSPSPKKPKTRYAESRYGGVFYANEGSAANRTIFYFHGGGYEHDFSLFHWRFLEQVIEKTDATLIVPAYRLIPFGSWKDAFDLIMPLYRQYIEENRDRKIILMGDSAGGGLSAALALQIKSENLRMPDELILMSPWVDVSMDNPDVMEYKKSDPWLSVDWLTVAGKHWSTGTDIHADQVSPIYGNWHEIRNITVFTGTSEVLYPDIRKFYAQLDQNSSNELIIGKEMNHVYPLLPIREAKAAKKIIFQKITR